MRSFLRIVFVLFFFSFHQEGNATRYLPSIVWDNLNPILSCKCNWFHPVVLIEIYDRFELVCPTPRIHTLLLAKRSRPKDHMNLNIFQRKWKGGIDAKGMNELKRQMISGDFCDPTHNDTAKIYTCKMGAPEGQMIRFAGDAGFYRDEIVVYFNNHDDGRESSLTSTDKRCAMALVTRATWNVAQKYDFTYGKNLDELLPQCNDVNTTCKEEGSTPAPCTSTTTIEPNQATPTSNQSNETISSEMPTTSQSKTKPTTDGNDTGNKASTKPSASTESSIQLGNSASRGSDNKDWDSFTYGFLAGFATLFIMNTFAALIYCLLCRPHKKKRKTNGVSYKVGDQSQSTPVSNAGSAESLPKKTPLPNNNNNQGINNIGFKRDTLERVDSPA